MEKPSNRNDVVNVDNPVNVVNGQVDPGARGESLLDVAIIGAGFAGIGVAAQLQRDGINNFVIYERGDDVGGVWRDNTYPGCRCDIPSSLYSFSFLPKPDWADRFATQAEILAYLREAVDVLGIGPAIKLGLAVDRVVWNAAQSWWDLTLADGTVRSARMVVVGSGTLNDPVIPKFDGLAGFGGRVFHSSDWPHDFSATGRRIAVIGTGASAIQIVPAIAPEVDHLTVVQRTAPWIMPRGDHPLSSWQREVNARVPFSMAVARGYDYLRREVVTPSFVRNGRVLSWMEWTSRRHLNSQVKDPVLRSKIDPSYRIGCKRVLMSDDWYPALQRPNVDLVTDPVAGVTESGLLLQQADGSPPRQVEVDTIVLATGFRVQRRAILSRIVGTTGDSMAAAMFKSAPTAYLGSTVPGFPNLILMTGPNTGLANNSMIVMIEAQAKYASDMARRIVQGASAADNVVIDLRPAAFERFAAEIEGRLTHSVWQNANCSSWYQDSLGRVTALWPGTTSEFRRRTRRLDERDYVISGPS